MRHHTQHKLIPSLQLVREVQQASPNIGFLNPFIPARYRAADQQRPSQTEIEDNVDVFEGATDARLIELMEERSNENWIYDSLFAVLDSRSLEDKTVEFHCLHVEFNDLAEEIGRRWIIWRVVFADSQEIITTFTVASPAIEEALLKYSDQFTGRDGIFQLQDCLQYAGFTK
jgi:hypothetical protein